MQRGLVLTALWSLVACGGAAQQTEGTTTGGGPLVVAEETTPPEGATEASPPNVVDVAEVRITSEGHPPVEIHADGQVRSGEIELGVIQPDGRVFSQAGEHTCTLDAEGRLTIEGEGEIYEIDDDATVRIVIGPGDRRYDPPEVVLEVGADGTVSGPLTERLAASHRVEGPAEGRRAAMMVFLCIEAPI